MCCIGCHCIVAGSYVYLSNQYHVHRKKQKHRAAGTDASPHHKDEVSLIKNMETTSSSPDTVMDMDQMTDTTSPSYSPARSSSQKLSSSTPFSSSKRKNNRVKSLDEQNAASQQFYESCCQWLISFCNC